MERRIYKYPIPLVDRPRVKMPAYHELLSVGLDPNDQLCAWALVDDRAAAAGVNTEVEFAIVGTGNPFPEYIRLETDATHVFLATVRQDPFIWHVFVKLP
jgi:hypothetical protein